jgi:hypothetical protein
MQVTTSIISTPKHVCKPRSTFQDHYDTALSDCLNFYFFLQLETGIKTHTVCEVAERVHNTTKILHIITFMSGVLCEGALALL